MKYAHMALGSPGGSRSGLLAAAALIALDGQHASHMPPSLEGGADSSDHGLGLGTKTAGIDPLYSGYRPDNLHLSAVMGSADRHRLDTLTTAIGPDGTEMRAPWQNGYFDTGTVVDRPHCFDTGHVLCTGIVTREASPDTSYDGAGDPHVIEMSRRRVPFGIGNSGLADWTRVGHATNQHDAPPASHTGYAVLLN